MNNQTELDIIFYTIVMAVVLIAIGYSYLKYKGIYISDFFKSSATLEAERKQNEEDAKTFGVPTSSEVVDMDFRNKYQIPPEKILRCFEGTKDKTIKILRMSRLPEGLVDSYYIESCGVFWGKYKNAIKKIADDRLSGITGNTLQDEIVRAQMFEELEHGLIISTLEKDRIARLVVNMKNILIKSMKEVLKNKNNAYKDIVYDTVVESNKLGEDFKTTKEISFLLMNSVSGEVANIFVEKVATEYGYYVKNNLVKEIIKRLKVDYTCAATKIDGFIEKFKFELKIKLYKETHKFIFSKMKDILSGVKRVPT